MKRTSFVTVPTIITVVFAIISLGLIPELVTASVNSSNSEISSAYLDWQLTVTGSVNNPLNLTWTEIVSLPQTIIYSELICVDWPDQVLMSGNWTGVKLRHLLETAGISPKAIKVGFYAEDGYSTDLTIEAAMFDDKILAYELNGETLYEGLRLVVPGKWGYKWINGVNHIEVVDYDFLGYWESRGYSDEADVDMTSEHVGIIPEFPSIISFLIVVILITLVIVLIKKKFEKPLMDPLPQRNARVVGYGNIGWQIISL